MKIFRHLIIVAGAAALVMACEPGAGTSDATTTGGGTTGGTTGDNTGGTTGGTTGGSTGATADTFPVVEFQDDASNATLDPCDKGTIKSPGADIDAAELEDIDSNVSNLAGCSLSATTSCENDSADAANAEGAPNSTGGEELGQYTSLNGGMMRCSFEGGVQAVKDDILTVYEVGKAGQGVEEKYSVRLCKDTAGNCTSDKGVGSGEASLPLNSFF